MPRDLLASTADDSLAVRILDFHFYLNRRFCAVRLRCNLCDKTGVSQVGKSFGDDFGSLIHLQTRKVSLTNIKFDLQVCKICEVDD